MADFLLPFSIGYLSCRLFIFFISNSQETSTSDKIILKWDKDNLSWRPCSKLPLNENSKYIIGQHVENSAIKLVNKRLKNGLQD